MKKSKLIILLLIILMVVTGCGEKKASSDEKDETEGIDSIEEVTKKSGVLYCTRGGTLDDGEANFQYIIDYKNDVILRLQSIEGVTSEKSEILDQYQEAYEKIDANYKNLKYYNTDVIRDEKSVTRKAVINYEKINIEQLLRIEGGEDNIIKDGKAKLDIWLELAKKFGTTCSEE